MKKLNLRRGKAPQLDRRSVLTVAGVSLSLPLLEAMLPVGKSAFAQDVGSPARMLTFFTPHGAHMQAFWPEKTGSDYVLSETLQPLKAIKDDLLVLNGLNNEPAYVVNASHPPAIGGLLTCTKVKGERRIYAGISMDQLAAQRIGSATRLPSLAVGQVRAGTGFPDNGYSAVYSGNISWASPTTPAPKTVGPQQTFDKIFGDGTGTGSGGINSQLQQLSQLDKSVIDAVLEDVKKLESQLGVNDREKLQGYLASIRALEHKLQPESQKVCAPFSRTADSMNSVESSRLMNDLMVMAFQCDLTRIITYMFSNGYGAYRYHHLGISGWHHSISHHGGNSANYTRLKKIDKYHMEELADLLLKLKQTTDIQGKSLLDSSVVQYISEIADGNSHSRSGLPALLAGGCNGYFKTGRHIKYEEGQPLANLYISMLDAMGVRVDTFGDDGTAKLPGLRT